MMIVKNIFLSVLLTVSSINSFAGWKNDQDNFETESKDSISILSLNKANPAAESEFNTLFDDILNSPTSNSVPLKVMRQVKQQAASYWKSASPDKQDLILQDLQKVQEHKAYIQGALTLLEGLENEKLFEAILQKTESTIVSLSYPIVWPNKHSLEKEFELAKTYNPAFRMQEEKVRSEVSPLFIDSMNEPERLNIIKAGLCVTPEALEANVRILKNTSQLFFTQNGYACSKVIAACLLSNPEETEAKLQMVIEDEESLYPDDMDENKLDLHTAKLMRLTLEELKQEASIS
jgi:hypothetical protein